MKLKTTRYLLTVIVSLLAALAVATIVASASSWRSSSTPSLTPPLPPTPGPPAPTSVPSTSTGRRTPVRNRDEAIERALYLDSLGNVREQPLTKERLAAEPDMIIVEQYATRQEASDVYWGDLFADPEVGAVPVWVVIIKGKVTVRILGFGAGLVEADGVTYVISQNSGRLLTIATGIPQKRSDRLSQDTSLP